MAVINIAGDLECGGKSGCCNPQDKETGKIYFVEILRIEKQVRNAEVFAKGTGNHRKQDNPAKHHHMVSLDVVKQQLNRKGVNKRGKKLIEPLYHRPYA